MNTILSTTALLLLALSLGGQSYPVNADTKKFQPGPITAVPVTAHPDLSIGSVLADKCICVPNKLDQVDALYMEGIKVEVWNPSRGEARDVTVRVVYHNLVSGGGRNHEQHYGALRPGKSTIRISANPDVHLAKRSVGITASIHSPNDPNPSNNSVTVRTCATYIVE